MTYREIQWFDDVILFNAQELKLKSFTFMQAWRWCQKALPSLPAYAGLEFQRKRFIHTLLNALENIPASGYGKIIYDGKWIVRVDLNEHGLASLQTTIFTHQQRC